jgi:hypothetical protein
MTSTVTGAEILAALERDEKVVGDEDLKGFLELCRGDIEALPTTVADLLDQPVTLALLVKARIAFMTYVLEKGSLAAAAASAETSTIVDDLFGALGGLFGGDSAALAKNADAVWARLLKLELKQLRAIDIEDSLRAAGISDREALFRDEMGMSDKLKRLYDANELTLDTLLREQPGLVVFKD